MEIEEVFEARIADAFATASTSRKIFNFREYSPLPSGDGQRLSVQANSTGRRYQSYSLSFTEPWLGGKKRNAFTVSVYDTKFSNAYDPALGRYTSSAARNSYL